MKVVVASLEVDGIRNFYKTCSTTARIQDICSFSFFVPTNPCLSCEETYFANVPNLVFVFRTTRHRFRSNLLPKSIFTTWSKKWQWAIQCDSYWPASITIIPSCCPFVNSWCHDRMKCKQHGQQTLFTLDLCTPSALQKLQAESWELFNIRSCPYYIGFFEQTH